MGAPARLRRSVERYNSQASLRTLARRYGVNQKTIAKWKGRSSVADRRTGPINATSTTLSIEEEAVVVAFRRHTLLPLDDCLYALQATIPHLTRSTLHRCLQRHGISRLPEVERTPNGQPEPEARAAVARRTNGRNVARRNACDRRVGARLASRRHDGARCRT